MEPINKKKPIFKWYDPILFITLIPLIGIFTKLLLFSCRLKTIKGKEGEEKAMLESGGKAVYATWHQRLIFHARHFGKTGLTVMVSQSRDGEYATRLAHRFGFNAVRGSSTRGGADALKNLTRKVREGVIGGMVVDGPLGPAREVKNGVIIIARDSGAPAIPVTWGADRCWILNSWDRLMIPKPFARIVFHYGEPVRVPESANGEEIERYRRTLEDILNQGCKWCDEQLGNERPWRKV